MVWLYLEFWSLAIKWTVFRLFFKSVVDIFKSLIVFIDSDWQILDSGVFYEIDY